MFLFDRNSKYSERDKYWKFKLKDSYNDFTQSNKEKVLILGDSQGKDFYVSSISSESLMNKYEFRYVDLDDECMNFNLMSENPAFNCNYIKSILERSTLIEDADQIVLAAHWKKNSWLLCVFSR